ncbi:MAG TPA: hypothetical protein VEM93_01160 [Actinomycetota bacterium]|nr:hypothetical protein [Actinomycetota bacterium]
MSRLVTLAVVLTLAASASCSSSGPSVDLTTFQGDGYAVGHPPSWEGCVAELPDVKAMAARFAGPTGAAGIPPVLQVSNEGTARPFEHALRFHELLFQVSPGFKQQGGDQDVDVEGAEQSKEIRFTDRPPFGGGGAQPLVLRGVFVLARTSEGNVVALTLTAEDQEFSSMSSTFDAIVASFQVGTDAASQMGQLAQCGQAPSP